MNVYRVTSKNQNDRSDQIVLADSPADALCEVLTRELTFGLGSSVDANGRYSVRLVAEVDGTTQIVPLSFRTSRRRTFTHEELLATIREEDDLPSEALYPTLPLASTLGG